MQEYPLNKQGICSNINIKTISFINPSKLSNNVYLLNELIDCPLGEGGVAQVHVGIMCLILHYIYNQPRCHQRYRVEKKLEFINHS